MSDAHSHGSFSAAGVPNRRKVRKGTQSCWECKRRKIRCTFAAPTDTICDGCRSRQTRCISQKFHDEAAPTSRKADRLSRMESLVEELVKRSSADMPDPSRQDQSDKDENTHAGQVSTDGQRGSNSEPPPSTIHNDIPDLESQVTGNLDDISSDLLAAWPSQHDLDLILSVRVDISVLFHGIVFLPYSIYFSEQITSPWRMLQLPPQGSHPVLIARRLLLLSALLQGIPACSVDKLAGLSSDYRAIMSRVFNTATRLVTTNEELINSLEGIECVLIESMYLNNSGNLRRAWLAVRRAMVMAQMMGLHAGTKSLNIFLESGTRYRIDPDYMWYRIVQSDRYLSLMLGLPQGSLENAFASPEALKDCTAVERLERMESVAGGLILQRNGAERTNLAATCNIDRMLQEAAALMPPQWWLMTPDHTAIADNGTKACEESVRLMNHFAYHHLLVQLHLPYMMLPSSINTSYDYSKMTAANASRSIITQFLSFRDFKLTSAYCRGVDFIVFVASTTLCLAHIEARRQHKADVGKGVTNFQSLRHQWLSDRGLLERTLEIMDTVAHSHDVVAQKISSILRPLLAIENNSVKGSCYHVCASSELDDKQESQCIGNTSEASHTLHIHIPYFGTIQIEHRPTVSDSVEPAQTHSQETYDNLVVLHEPLNPDKQEEQALPAGYKISTTKSVNTDWQTAPFFLGQTEPPNQLGSTSWDKYLSPFGVNEAQENYLLVPGLTADVTDWALQGVDMALFSNFTQDLADFNASRTQPRTQ